MASFLLSYVFVLLAGAQDYDAQIKAYLQKELTKYTAIEIVSVQYPQEVQTGKAGLQINTTKAVVVNGGFAYLPVLITPPGKPPLYSVLSVKLQLFAPVWIATRPIGVASELLASDFRLEVKDVTKVRGDFVTKDFRFEKAVAAMHINEGVVLTQNMMRERPLVKFGDELTGYISVGGIEVTLQVTARENGYVGGTIRVVSKDKKIYKGIVESEDRVKIVE